MASISEAQYVTPKGFILGFIGGFLATVIFHQMALFALNSIGIAKAPLWVMDPVPPFGVPRIVSLAFWGGVFGLFYPLLQARFESAGAFIVAGIIFGAIVPTLCSWYIVNAIRGVPLGPNGGWVLPSVLIGPIVNGAWGFGTALFLLSFNRR
jgi:hypothetical protein